MLLLDEAIVDARVRVLVWDGTGGTSSSNDMGCRFCGFEFDRGRSRLGTSPPCSERCSEFARLRWDEREGALATSRCDISCLVVEADGWSLILLAQHPIVRREDEGCFLKRPPHGTLVSIKKFPRREKLACDPRACTRDISTVSIPVLALYSIPFHQPASNIPSLSSTLFLTPIESPPVANQYQACNFRFVVALSVSGTGEPHFTFVLPSLSDCPMYYQCMHVVITARHRS